MDFNPQDENIGRMTMEYFGAINWELLVVTVSMVLVCAVPFVELFADLWRSHFKKG